MISFRFLPSPWRLVTYSLVAASVRIRVVAMRHSALLAWRLPPRLRRCRMVCPDDAWTGLVPHSAAKDAFCFHSPGVVAGGDQQSGGCVRAHTGGGQQRRVRPSAETADVSLELGDLSVEGLVSAGQVA